MEDFFVDDEFYSDLGEWLQDRYDDEEVRQLPEDYSFEVRPGKLEKIFNIKIDDVVDFITTHTDRWEDRFPEFADSTFDKIKKAIIGSVDIDKMNELLPSLYYPTTEKAIVTKKDLVDYIS